jgi:hypothetical protein
VFLDEGDGFDSSGEPKLADDPFASEPAPSKPAAAKAEVVVQPAPKEDVMPELKPDTKLDENLVAKPVAKKPAKEKPVASKPAPKAPVAVKAPPKAKPVVLEPVMSEPAESDVAITDEAAPPVEPVKVKKAKKAYNKFVGGSYMTTTDACPMMRGPAAVGEPMTLVKPARKIWTEEGDSQWVKAYNKSGEPGYVSKDCFR